MNVIFEFMTESDFLSLKTLNSLVKQVLADNFLEDVWVVAEIAELKVASSGHCYMELVDKQEDRIVARSKANLWNRQYQEVQSNFISETGKTLEIGMKVLLRVAVGFHELYGMSLTVKTIDPQFTMGEMARKRKEVIDRLVKEGLMDLNKMLELALVPKRIAVISARKAAGYEDFCHQLDQNARGYIVEHSLFEATLQGDRALASLLEAIEEIRGRSADFDAVVIIRGGGASLDLRVFDQWDIAAAVARFPLPILTGIGHERDQSVVDLVAHVCLKTPTAVAAFILQQFEEFEEQLLEIASDLEGTVAGQLRDKRYVLDRAGNLFSERVNRFISGRRLSLAGKKKDLLHQSHQLFSEERKRRSADRLRLKRSIYRKTKDLEYQLSHKKYELRQFLVQSIRSKKEGLKLVGEQLKWVDPQKVLDRGYALIRSEHNEVIKSVKEINPDQVLKVQLKDGKFEVKSTNV